MDRGKVVREGKRREGEMNAGRNKGILGVVLRVEREGGQTHLTEAKNKDEEELMEERLGEKGRDRGNGG